MKYSGFVYDKSGSPLKGIRVSDGRNVCVTDEKGFYSLEGWERDVLIFCNVLTNSHNDWFSIITEEKSTYDFYLDPIKDQKKYTFLHLSDTEIARKGCDSFIPWLKKTVEENNAAFLFHGGDLADMDGVQRHYKEMSQEAIGCPVRYCLGNHDFLVGDYAEQVYETLYGPIWYSFDLGNIHYISLPYPESAWGFYTRYELRDEYEFIKNDLAALNEKKPIVIFRHNSCKEGENFLVNIEDQTFDLPKMGLIAWIQGHDHTNFLIEKNKVLHMCSSRPDSGGIDNTAGSVRRVFIDGEKITTDIQFNLLAHTEKASPLWLTKLDGFVEYASLIESENKLFCATIDDGYPKKCGVYGINKENGEILWFFPTKNSIKNDICANEKQVFVQDCEGTVYSICAESGKLLWIFEDCQGEKYFHRCSVATNGETVYAGNGRKLFFLRSSDGKKICEIDPQKRGDHAPSKHVFSDDKEIIFCNAQWLRLAAVNAKSGETLWELKSQKAEIGNPGAFWYRTNTPLYHDGKIYAFGFSHGAIADAKTGEILLHKAIPHKTEVVGSAAISDGVLYLPTATQGVVALDAETLDELWRYPVDNGLVFSSSYIVGSKQTVEAPVQIIDDQIVFAANDGFVYFYDKKEPILKKKIPLHFASLTAPIIKKDHLYAVNFDGTVGKYKI